MSIFTRKENNTDWGPIADIMSGLMIVFLFIAVVYMRSVRKERDYMKDIVETHQILQKDLYIDLYNEFKDDLLKWGAELDENLSFRFNEPDVLFDVGSANLKPTFREILSDFFPRYIAQLYSEKYRNDIDEIRIEGHTSSEWQSKVSDDRAYFNNMELSQNRTRTVLEYVLTNISFDPVEKEWIRKLTTANGLSSSRLILINDIEDKERSRRVEFRIKTKAEEKFNSILNVN